MVRREAKREGPTQHEEGVEVRHGSECHLKILLKGRQPPVFQFIEDFKLPPPATEGESNKRTVVTHLLPLLLTIRSRWMSTRLLQHRSLVQHMLLGGKL